MRYRCLICVLSLSLFLQGCSISYECGDMFKVDGKQSVVVQVDDAGMPLMLLSLDEAVDIDADSAARWATSLGEGWSLPTKEEMEYLKKYKSLINIKLEKKGESPFLKNQTFYWTSTDCSESHTYACGPQGIKCYFNTNSSHLYRARAVYKRRTEN